MPTLRTALAPLTLVAASALLLAGCSAGGSTERSSTPEPSRTATATATPTSTPKASSSKQQQCVTLLKSTQDAQGEMSDALSKLSSDPSAAIAALQKFDSDFAASAGEVTDPELAPVATKASAALHDLVTTVQAASQNQDQNAASQLQAKATAVQEAFQEVGTVCSSS